MTTPDNPSKPIPAGSKNVADYRLISQDYAKEALKACILINGGAAVATLSQVDKLLSLGGGHHLIWQAKGAMICWAIGVGTGAFGWVFGFCSARYVDKSEREKESAAEHIKRSDRLMIFGGRLVAGSMAAFAVGCILLVFGF